MVYDNIKMFGIFRATRAYSLHPRMAMGAPVGSADAAKFIEKYTVRNDPSKMVTISYQQSETTSANTQYAMLPPRKIVNNYCVIVGDKLFEIANATADAREFLLTAPKDVILMYNTRTFKYNGRQMGIYHKSYSSGTSMVAMFGLAATGAVAFGMLCVHPLFLLIGLPYLFIVAGSYVFSIN